MAIPTGDGPWAVVARLALLACGVAAWQWSITMLPRFGERVFRGRLPTAFHSMWDTPEPPPTRNRIQTFLKNWHMLLFGIIGLIGAAVEIDPDTPWLKLKGLPRKYQNALNLATWALSHPNTARSVSLAVGFICIAVFVYRLRRAGNHTTDVNFNSLNTDGVTEISEADSAPAPLRDVGS